MNTTVYQKYISRYAETFTLVERYDEEEDFYSTEVLPTSVTSKMNRDELFAVINELMFWQNEKATWEE